MMVKIYIEQNQMNIIHLLDGDWVGFLFVLFLSFQFVLLFLFFWYRSRGQGLKRDPAQI